MEKAFLFFFWSCKRIWTTKKILQREYKWRINLSLTDNTKNITLMEGVAAVLAWAWVSRVAAKTIRLEEPAVWIWLDSSSSSRLVAKWLMNELMTVKDHFIIFLDPEWQQANDLIVDQEVEHYWGYFVDNNNTVYLHSKYISFRLLLVDLLPDLLMPLICRWF